ncbi:ABC transporter substrate-binding protein [Propionibacteriaceae bacterium G1746]
MTTRRTFLMTAGALATAAVVAGCSQTASSGNTLRFTWWGNAGRAERTEKALAEFKKANSGLDIQTEFMDWTQYWDKLSTQVAGGNPPDLLQMSEAYQGQYVKSSSLHDLRALIDEKSIDLTSMAKGSLPDSGPVTAVPWTVNMRSVLASKAGLEKAGVDPAIDLTGMSWQTYGDFLSDVTDKAGIPASVDPGMSIENFETWLHQQGKSLYGEKAAGFSADDLIAFWDMTLAWSNAKIVTDPSTTSKMANGGTELAALVTKAAVLDYRWSSEAVIFAGLGVDDITLLAPPNEKGHPGRFQHAAMLLSVSAKAKDPKKAAELLAFLITAPESAAQIGMERGAPASTTAATAISSSLKPVEQAVLAYHKTAEGALHPVPRIVPPGGGEMLTTFTRLYESVVFKRADKAAAADEFTTKVSALAGA